MPSTFLRYCLSVVLLASAWALCSAARPASNNIATFSVVAYNPATGEVGVAVQSKFFAVGSVVPWAKAGAGAVATQAFGNTTFGPRGLELLAQGVPPEQAIQALLTGDKDALRRQVGLVSSVLGQAANWTGSECMAWAGGNSGVAPDGVVYAVQGNILAGEQVADAMAAAMADPASIPPGLSAGEQLALATPDLAGRMLGALLAGQAAGGDSRGMQSAALKVCQAGMGYGGYNDVKYDLRVDDAVDPFDELARLLNIARPIALANEGYMKLYTGSRAEAIAIFTQLVQLQPEEPTHHYNLACALSLTGHSDEAMAELALAVAGDEKLRASAAQDPDLVALREREDFKALIGTTLVAQ